MPYKYCFEGQVLRRGEFLLLSVEVEIGVLSHAERKVLELRVLPLFEIYCCCAAAAASGDWSHPE